MSRPVSSQKEYDLYVSSDPAFAPPPAKPAKDASKDDVEKFSAEVDEYLAKWRAARLTGDYSAMLLEGKTPRKYVIGQPDRNVWRQIQDRAGLDKSCSRYIGEATMMALLTRLTLRSVPSLDIRITYAPDPEWDNWRLAQQDVINVLDDIDPSIVGEIGFEAFKKLVNFSPL